jgi:Tol biopolymer transport system component
MRKLLLDRSPGGGKFASVLLGLACCASLALTSVAGPLRLLSSSDLAPVPGGGGGGDSSTPILTPDGRYVLFASTAGNLVTDTNGNALPASAPLTPNVFLRDRISGTTTLVSVNLAGTGGGNGGSYPAGISSNGRYALFESSASDLVPVDTNNAVDIFVRDLLSGTNLLVSVSTNGGSGNGACRSSVITPDGRYVAFVSEANNLVPDDTNQIADVFVRDLLAGATMLASVGAVSTNAISYGGSSEAPKITSDGRYVAFLSTATNPVVANPVWGVRTLSDIYVRDLAGGTTVCASAGVGATFTSVRRVPPTVTAVCYNHVISTNGQFVAYEASIGPDGSSLVPGFILRYNLQSGVTDLVHTNANLLSPASARENVSSLDMSPDGRFVAFIANTNDTSGSTTCALLWDAQTATTALLSGTLSNTVPANSVCDSPVLTPDGRFAVFSSSATNLVTNSLSGDLHIYLRDVQAGLTTLVDADTNGVGRPLSSVTAPSLSADGRYVAFDNFDSTLVSNDSNHACDTFVRDVVAGTTELVSIRDPALPSSSANGLSGISTHSISGDGRWLAFYSEADNLVANDTNGIRDIFIRDLLLGTNGLVSVATNGLPGDGFSSEPAISGDGRYVAFTSSADNLVAGDTNKALDVIVRDLQSGTTVLVSVSTSGAGPGNSSSYSPTISADGRYILFQSMAGNLAPGSFSFENLFLRDVVAARTYALTTAGVNSPGCMSPDGRFVAYVDVSRRLYLWDTQAATRVLTNSSSSAIVAAVSPDGNRIAVWTGGNPTTLNVIDRAANTNWNIRSTTTQPPKSSILRFNSDGNFLAYVATNSGLSHIYLYDFQAATNILVTHSFDSFTTGADANSVAPDLSADGRFVIYRSAADNLVAGDTNGVPDIFLYDRRTGANTLLSANQFGAWSANNRSLGPVFSGDGRTLIFQSWASDLAPSDFNASSDVFAYTFLYAVIVPGASPAQRPTVSFPVFAGKTFRVQYKNRLNDPNWQDLTDPITVVGNQGCFTDSSPDSSQRFYRVVAY